MSEPYRPCPTNNFNTTLPLSVNPGPLLSGHGTPEGTIIGIPGQGYTDVDSDYFYVKIKGSGNTGWVQVGIATATTSGGGGGTGNVYYGTGTDPNGVITAEAPAIYYSITDGSKWAKVNTGNNNTGWEVFIAGA